MSGTNKMNTPSILSGGVFAKKMGTNLYIFDISNTGDVSQTVVTTEGGVQRSLRDRFGDVVNVKGFGAKGDGATDDTSAFANAIAASSERVFVPSGRYVVGSSIDINKCYGDGSLIYKTGREISLNGVVEADAHSQLFLQEINPSTNETFQDVTIIGNKIFAARETANGIKISQYPLNFDVNTSYSVGTRAGSVAEAEYELAMTSHGEGVHGFIDDENQIWLYVPYTPDTGNKGFYKVKWNTTSTPTFTPYVLNELPNQAQIAVSHDGKYLVACRTTNINYAGSANIYGNQIYVYDRIEAETSQNALSIARFNIPKTGSITTRSGLDCDDRYIYLLTSTDQFGDDQNISVYDFSGTLIKEWTVDGWIACFPNDVLNGSDGWYITAHEAEGLCLYKDMLVFYAKAYFHKPTSFCNLDGETFFATQASTGKNPLTESSYWVRTATVESVADWDAEAEYTAPTSLIHHKFICAIAPKGRYAKEYPINMRLFNTSNSNLEGNDGVLITTTTNNDIILGRKNKRVNRVLPSVVVSDGSLAICATETFDGVNENKRFASIQKGADGVFAVRGHGGAVAAGATFYMYPCAGYQAGDAFYGAFRLWAGGSEALRVNNTALYSYRDVVPSGHNQKDLGTSSVRWKNVYCQTGAFNGSDSRFKSAIADPSDALMRAWGKVGFKVFKYIDAIEEKGEDKARLHVGVIAQEIVEAFESEGLDAMQYGFIAHNCFEDTYEDVEVVDEQEQFDESGALIKKEKTHIEKRLVSKAHDEYLIRYSEVLALECAYQRWRLEQLEERLNQLTNSNS